MNQAQSLLNSVNSFLNTERFTPYVAPEVSIDPDAELRTEVQEILRALGLPENVIQIRTSGARLLAEAERLDLI